MKAPSSSVNNASSKGLLLTIAIAMASGATTSGRSERTRIRRKSLDLIALEAEAKINP